MAKCIKIIRKSQRVCAGSLNKKIDLRLRIIGAPEGYSVDFTENFTILKNIWAMIETVAGKVFFDGSNTDKSITHNFYIRYINGIDVTAENWIKYNDKYFDIVNIEDLDEDHRFLLLRSTERGDNSLKVNYA